MATEKKVIGFKIVRNNNDSGWRSSEYGKLTISFGYISTTDLADSIKEAIKRQRTDRVEHYVKKATFLTSNGGGTVYHDFSSDHKIEMNWQDDRDNGRNRWYGFDGNVPMNESAMKLAAKFMKANADTYSGIKQSPYDVVSALLAMGAVPLKWIPGNGAGIGGEYVPNDTFNVFDEIPQYVPPVVNEVETASDDRVLVTA